MKAISKGDRARRTELVTKLNDAHEKLLSAIDDFNHKMEEAWRGVEDELSRYNELRTEAKEFVDEIVQNIDDYVSERSEKWQEGEKAQAYEEWKGEWENVGLDEVDLNKPDEVSFDEENAGDALDAPATEVSA